MVLAEIEGKNRAIHAHNGMVWNICSAFSPCSSLGGSILLTRIVWTKDRSMTNNRRIWIVPLQRRISHSALGYVHTSYIGASLRWSSARIV